MPMRLSQAKLVRIRIKSGCMSTTGTGRAVVSSNPYRLVPKVEGEQDTSFGGRYRTVLSGLVAVSKKKRAFGGECPNYAACLHTKDGCYVAVRSAGTQHAAASQSVSQSVVCLVVLLFLYRLLSPSPSSVRSERSSFFFFTLTTRDDEVARAHAETKNTYHK